MVQETDVEKLIRDQEIKIAITQHNMNQEKGLDDKPSLYYESVLNRQVAELNRLKIRKREGF